MAPLTSRNPTAPPKSSPVTGSGSCSAAIGLPKIALEGLASKRYAAPASPVPSVAPGAPIRAVVPLPATEAPNSPPPSGWAKVQSRLPEGPYKNAAPASGPAVLSRGEPIRMSGPTDATPSPGPLSELPGAPTSRSVPTVAIAAPKSSPGSGSGSSKTWIRVP